MIIGPSYKWQSLLLSFAMRIEYFLDRHVHFVVVELLWKSNHDQHLFHYLVGRNDHVSAWPAMENPRWVLSLPESACVRGHIGSGDGFVNEQTGRFRTEQHVACHLLPKGTLTQENLTHSHGICSGARILKGS